MSKPAGYIVRSKDMKALKHELNRVCSNTGDLWAAARTLVGWAETQQTQLPPVSVASLALPSEADALDRILDAYLADQSIEDALSEIGRILFETGRVS